MTELTELLCTAMLSGDFLFMHNVYNLKHICCLIICKITIFLNNSSPASSNACTASPTVDT